MNCMNWGVDWGESVPAVSGWYSNGRHDIRTSAQSRPLAAAAAAVAPDTAAMRPRHTAAAAAALGGGIYTIVA